MENMKENFQKNRIIGYARIGICGPTIEFESRKLKLAGCASLHFDKVSDPKEERRELKMILNDIKPGDKIIVTRLDRIARSSFDLLSILRFIADSGGHFQSISEPWAEISASTGSLMLNILGGLIDLERDLIKILGAEGRSRAKDRGKLIGRPLALTDQQTAELRQGRLNGASVQELANKYNVSTATISRLTVDVRRSLVGKAGGESKRRVKTKGLPIGRPPALSTQQAAEVRQKRLTGVKLQTLADSYNVCKATIFRVTADIERDIIRARKAKDRDSVKSPKQPVGRPTALTAQQIIEIHRKIQEGVSLRELAYSYKVCKATISRSLKTVKY